MKSAGLRAGTYAVRLRGTLWPFIVTLLSALNGYLHKGKYKDIYSVPTKAQKLIFEAFGIDIPLTDAGSC